MQNPLKTSLTDAGLLFENSAAGIQISGDSGSGKSNAMEVMMQVLADSGQGFLLLDPHGDLAASVADYCASLPERLKRRVLLIHPANTVAIAPINPLAVPIHGSDSFLWRARIASKVSHVSRILLHAWGERDFNSKPRMFKYTHLYLSTLARAGLTIPDVRHFFDVQSSVYIALSRVAPDLIARLELEELADMRARDRDDLIASSKNRFLGFLENPIVEAALGRCDGIDLRTLVQQGAIIIVNLERGGVLREEDVEIFANLWLCELLYAVFNTPKEERVPYFAFIDELPVFQSSATQLVAALTQIRKFKLRLVCSHQGTQFFEERTEDRLLNALVGQCATHLYFRHANPVDAKYFSEIAELRTLDPYRLKHVLRQSQQYQDGHDIVTLIDEGENWTDAEQQGGADASGTTHSTSDSRTNSTATSENVTRQEDALHDAVSRARAETIGNSATSADTRGTTETHSANWSRTQSRGTSRTRKQTIVPRIKTREIVASVQFLSTEEQITIGASQMSSYSTGTALLYSAGNPAACVTLPLAKQPYARTPKHGRKKRRELGQLVAARPEYTTLRAITDERTSVERALVQQLHAPAQPESLPRPGAAVEIAYQEPEHPELGI